MANSKNKQAALDAAIDVTEALAELMSDYEFEIGINEAGELVLHMPNYDDQVKLVPCLNCEALWKISQDLQDSSGKGRSEKEAKLHSKVNKEFWGIVYDSDDCYTVARICIISIDPDAELRPYEYQLVDDAYDTGWCGDSDLFTIRSKAFDELRARERKVYEDRCKQIDEQERS